MNVNRKVFKLPPFIHLAPQTSRQTQRDLSFLRENLDLRKLNIYLHHISSHSFFYICSSETYSICQQVHTTHTMSLGMMNGCFFSPPTKTHTYLIYKQRWGSVKYWLNVISFNSFPSWWWCWWCFEIIIFAVRKGRLMCLRCKMKKCDDKLGILLIWNAFFERWQIINI